MGARHRQHDQAVLWAPGRCEVGYNPHKPGRPSHGYHTYMLSNLRLVLGVDVQPGDEYNCQTATGLWSLLDHLGPTRRPALLRGDKAWGIERVMSRAEQDGLAYLFRLRMTANVKRALTNRCSRADWTDAGQGWQGKETTLRLVGWSRQRRIVLLRRKLARVLVIPIARTRAAAAELCRGRARSRGVGIRRTGHLAGQRDPDAGPAVSRSGRLREHVR